MRAQQEQTKQQYYRVEYMNRSLELLKLATMAKVPGEMIPTLFGSSTAGSLPTPSPSPMASPTQVCGMPAVPTVPTVPALSPISTTSNGPVPILRHPMPNHSRSRSEYSIRGNSLRTSNFAPEFKFGDQQQRQQPRQHHHRQISPLVQPASPTRLSSPTRNTSLPPRHQLSPARIGAQAVSSLSNSILNPQISELRHGTSHQRTFSLPTNVSIPESKPLTFAPQETPKKRKFTATQIDLTVLETPSRQPDTSIELASPPQSPA